MAPLRTIHAENPGPFTLEGTRTFILGREHVAIIDPGPALEDHLQTLAREVAKARSVTLVLTHWHGDHAGGVDRLRSLLSARTGRLPAVVGSGHPAAHPPEEPVSTDAGRLEAIATPGHSRDHLCFRWIEEEALFAGDMVLGVGDTTWVGEYPGCVADYLDSLALLESIPLRTVYPTHGPVVTDVPGLWRRYRDHRESRIARVREVLREVEEGELLEAVYGDAVPEGLADAALASLKSLVEYVRSHPEGTP